MQGYVIVCQFRSGVIDCVINGVYGTREEAKEKIDKLKIEDKERNRKYKYSAHYFSTETEK